MVCCVVAAGAATVVSCVVVVVVADSSWCAHDARNKPAETDRSKDRMVSFFIMNSSCISYSSQVPPVDVLGDTFSGLILGNGDLAPQFAGGVDGIDHLHQGDCLVRVVDRLAFAQDRLNKVLEL